MNSTPPRPPATPLRPLVNLWAGAASAGIFYAEYLGLGASLGHALLGDTPTASATGSLLVLLSVVLGALWALPGQAVFLAGPRGASVAILGGLAAWLGHSLGSTPAQQATVVGLLLVGAALAVLGGRHPTVQAVLQKAPVWLVQGFMYATAANIVSGAVTDKLYGCLLVHEAWSWSLYLPAVALGVLWKPALLALLQQGQSPRTQRLLKALQPLGLLVAAAGSWCAYEASMLAMPHAGLCKRLGDTTLDWALLAERAQHVSSLFSGALPPLAMLATLATGVLIGLVLLLENLTAFAPDGDALSAHQRARLLDISVTTNLLAACVGGSCASYSNSRTVALRNLGATHPMAGLVHGLAVAAIALLAGRWVALVPDLTVTVALTLVGIQMIGDATQMLWRHAYHPQAQPPQLLAGALFWVVLLVSIASGKSLLGFLVGAALAWAAHGLAQRRSREQVTP
jgi:MFS superfamily sulfate permease-like transporter